MFTAKIIPNSPTFEISGFGPRNELRIRVTSKPVKGNANTELEKELSKRLQAPVQIAQGFLSQRKKIHIALAPSEALKRIATVSVQ